MQMWPFILEKVEAATEGMQKVAVGGVLNVAEAMQRLTAGEVAAAVPNTAHRICIRCAGPALCPDHGHAAPHLRHVRPLRGACTQPVGIASHDLS